MKRLLSLMIVALFVTIQVMAQTSSATLVHDGTLSSFTGENALSEAVAAAADGDIITLSAGTFNGCTINKAITLRGAGMEADELGRQTTISGDLKIYGPKSFSIEGVFMPTSEIVFGNLGSFYMNKCTVNKCLGKKDWQGNTVSQSVITQCKIGEVPLGEVGGSANFYNCYIDIHSGSNTIYRFDNCVIKASSRNRLRGSFVNSIIIYSDQYFPVAADHCVANFDIDADHGSNNYKVESASDIFKNFDESATWYTRDLTLKDEAKAKYLGNDGTEVGIYGGNMPFSPFVDQPFIKRLKVAPRSSRDGKLSVDIEVSE